VIIAHLTNAADALLVCETESTLAALHRQFVESVDPWNVADFFRVSPCQANVVRERLQAFLVQWAIDLAPPNQPTPAMTSICAIGLLLRRAPINQSTSNAVTIVVPTSSPESSNTIKRVQ